MTPLVLGRALPQSFTLESLDTCSISSFPPLLPSCMARQISASYPSAQDPLGIDQQLVHIDTATCLVTGRYTLRPGRRRSSSPVCLRLPTVMRWSCTTVEIWAKTASYRAHQSFQNRYPPLMRGSKVLRWRRGSPQCCTVHSHLAVCALLYTN